MPGTNTKYLATRTAVGGYTHYRRFPVLKYGISGPIGVLTYIISRTGSYRHYRRCPVLTHAMLLSGMDVHLFAHADIVAPP
eukprot:718677-Rhodomonas_salina.4